MRSSTCYLAPKTISTSAMAEKPLLVYRASAGSGKTFSLTRQYLKHLLQQGRRVVPERIQAVTFTKKATAEMKVRIIGELATLSHHPEQSAHRSWLTDQLRISESELTLRAESALRLLLRDYSNFRVRTIDSFFQEVVRAFAYDLGRSSVPTVWLESDRLHEEAINELLSRLEQLAGSSPTAPPQSEAQTPELQQAERESLMQERSQLQSLYEDIFERGERQSGMKNSLRELAKQFEKGKLAGVTGEGGRAFPSPLQVQQLKDLVGKHYEETRRQILSLCRTYIDDFVREVGPIDEVVSHGKDGFLSPLTKINHSMELFQNNTLTIYSTKRYRTFVDGETRKARSGFPQAKSKVISDATEEAWHQRLKELDAELQRLLPLYLTLGAIRDKIAPLTLIASLADIMEEYRREENIVLMSDASVLLEQILSGGGKLSPEEQLDEPNFIYERVGAKIEHHMIDEFQDTNREQYAGFRPLINNSITEGKGCLIVGDAKQSIYRFRDSDATLLSNDIVRDFAGSLQAESLITNYRSDRNIIAFNNALFTALIPAVERLFRDLDLRDGEEEEEYTALQEMVTNLVATYADVEQKPNSTNPGLVVVHRYADSQKGGGGKSKEPEPEEAEPEPELSEDELEELSDEEYFLHGVRADIKDLELQQLVQVVRDVQLRGYRASDIAVLVLKRTVATKVAEALSVASRWERDARISYDFTSEEALLVSSALSVSFVIAAMYYMLHPADPTYRENIQTCYQQASKSERTLSEHELDELHRLGRRSLYEIAEGLIARYPEVFVAAEEAYVIKLLELLHLQGQDEAADLPDFLDYWESKGKTNKIVSSASERTLTIMTIHKSKGLDFPVVLLPSLDKRKLLPSSDQADTLWLKLPSALPQEILDCGIRQVPVEHKEALGNSYFRLQHLQELLRNAFDLLNLLYVACTRPSHELHLWVPNATKSKGSRGKSQRDILEDFSHLQSLLTVLFDDPAFREANPFYAETQMDGAQIPEDAPHNPEASRGGEAESSEVADAILPIGQLRSYPSTEGLDRLSKDMDRFFQQITQRPLEERPRREVGWVMHLVLSQIRTEADLPRALQRVLHKGYVPEEEISLLEERLRAILNHDSCRRWFDGSAQVITERTILYREAERSSRPDRVMRYADDRVEVIDYKFGRHEASHSRQVQRYMRLLQQMGFADVRGYLCYINDDGVQDIAEVYAPRS